MIGVINRIIFVGIGKLFYKRIVQELSRTKNRLNIHVTEVDTYIEAKQFIKISGFTVVVLNQKSNESYEDFFHFVRKSPLNSEAGVIFYCDNLNDYNSVKDWCYSRGIGCFLSTDNSAANDSFELIQDTVRAYHHRMRMTVSYDEFDVNFLVQIAEVYVYFLKDQEFSMQYERVSEMVCTIHRLSHQVLESFKIVDLMGKLIIGTTKNSRLSSKEYKILMSIGYLNTILSNTSKEDYQNDRSHIFKIILNEAENFATINILPDKSKSAINSSLVGYSLIKINK